MLPHSDIEYIPKKTYRLTPLLTYGEDVVLVVGPVQNAPARTQVQMARGRKARARCAMAGGNKQANGRRAGVPCAGDVMKGYLRLAPAHTLALTPPAAIRPYNP